VACKRMLHAREMRGLYPWYGMQR